MEEADLLADQVAVLDCGRVIATGSPPELKAKVGGDHLELTVPDPDYHKLQDADLQRLGVQEGLEPLAYILGSTPESCLSIRPAVCGGVCFWAWSGSRRGDQGS
jgi:ABC-type multidrug transport system ATPase subunit